MKNIFEINTSLNTEKGFNILSAIVLISFIILIITLKLNLSTTLSVISILIVNIIILYLLSKRLCKFRLSFEKIKIIYPYNKLKTKTILTTQINNVKYIDAGKGSKILDVFTKNEFGDNSYRILLSVSHFKVGHLLRYYAENGIRVDLNGYNDAELILYVQGRINEFPMTNDTEIISK